ncbi:MAG TPA: RNA repair transcriptional activator RtcR family protein, partial [Thermoanaerobaculia bacterium]|nr:RNA repair transcriptional activator RtcR family protein [Thermoanaerobaculia bacterium]
MKKVVVLGFIGPQLDSGAGAARWSKWRPSVALCQHEDLVVHRFELLTSKKYEKLAHQVAADIATVSPETTVNIRDFELQNPWDFEEVYAALHDLARTYTFDPEQEEYLVHITTGTHVVQICLFLLTESRHFPGRLLQTSPGGHDPVPGTYSIVDLDLSRYDRLA